MLNNLKALVVVFTIAAIVFAVARPVCLRFMAENDFVRRRNIWFALTIAAFVSPNFWLFAAVALPLLAWGARRDPNPLALYMLVYCVIPPIISFEIPVVGIDALFRMNYVRVLAFATLIPVAWRLIQSKENKEAFRFTTMDFLILAFGALQLALLMPYESGTQTLRRGFLYFLDVIPLYFVATRACSSRQAIVEVLATFCLLCAILAPLAIFESQRSWLLYAGIGNSWGNVDPLQYATRDGSLRAQVTAGQSIPLGFLLAFGFGLWLYLSSHVKSRRLTVAFGILMWAGMIAAHARAPWVAAIAVFFTYLILGPDGTARFVKASLVATLFAGLVLVSPIGERVIDNLPFVGTVGTENVEYRKELAAQSWEMIKRNPVFGNPNVLKDLDSLRQGEGIIDLLNAYTTIAMYYGVPALFLYLGPYLIGIGKAYRFSRRSARLDPDLSLLGAILVACMLGFLLAMGMGGFGPVVMTFSMVVIGLSVGYARLGQQKETPRAEPSHQPRTESQWNMKRG